MTGRTRLSIGFTSDGIRCDAWLYLPDAAGTVPASPERRTHA